FIVRVQPGGLAAGIMRAMAPQMIGMTFIAFVREFAGPGGLGLDDSDLHFHLSQDNRADAAAVQSDFTVEEVRCSAGDASAVFVFTQARSCVRAISMKHPHCGE